MASSFVQMSSMISARKKVLPGISPFQELHNKNVVAERMNRTILKKVRCMLSHSTLGKEFWAEAASTACYLINRSPNRSLDCKIPEEVWSGNPVDYSNFRII